MCFLGVVATVVETDSPSFRLISPCLVTVEAVAIGVVSIFASGSICTCVVAAVEEMDDVSSSLGDVFGISV